MAHAVVNAALSLAKGENALVGVSSAVTAEAVGMISQAYYGKKPSELTDEQKQTVSALASLAAGLAGGLVGGDTASVVSGMQTGKVTVENNNLATVARLGVTACAEVATCRNMVVEKGLGALLGIGVAKTALDNLSSVERDEVFMVALSGKADQIEKLTPKQRAAYDYMVGQDQKGLITIFPKPDRELTDGKLVNPGHGDHQGIVNTGNNQPIESGPTHTGNSDGLANTGGTSTVTPLPDGPNKDDFIYMSDGHMLGANGVKVPSKTIWKGVGKERIDVENPNPGQRPGQVHYQDNKNNKYYYDPRNNDFYMFDSKKNKVPAPSSVNKLLDDPKFKQAIDKGMNQYLGEK